MTARRDLLPSQTSGGVSVVGSGSSQTDSAVCMRDRANAAPRWRLVSDDGSHPSVMFMGDEVTA
ncbi:hypothetical protein [Salipiger sp. HF18]|uniref:hypothetical protein n=1 Tax=Salipiger sp. HF18 TaxID=2721557 RepID=UPI00158A86DA|nr:hypothetical protein [Salipiger sp. HF18]